MGKRTPETSGLANFIPAHLNRPRRQVMAIARMELLFPHDHTRKPFMGQLPTIKNVRRGKRSLALAPQLAIRLDTVIDSCIQLTWGYKIQLA